MVWQLMSRPSRQVPSGLVSAEWRFEPNLQWSTRNMGLLPSVMVPRSGAIAPLGYDPLDPTAVESLEVTTSAGTSVLRDLIEGERIDGLIVIHEGTVRYEQYFGDFGPDDHHIWFSMTKSLIATIYGIMAPELGIDETKTPADYIPSLAGSAFDAVSIREVLNMVSALDYSEDYEDLTPGSVHLDYFMRLGMLPSAELMTMDPNVDGAIRGVRNMLARFPAADGGVPGEVFNYQSPNVDVIGWLVEELSGTPIQDLISERIWSKIGAEHDGLFCMDPDFAPMATAGFNTTLRDAARFGLMSLANGRYGDQQIVPEAWSKDTYALTDADLSAVAKGTNKIEGDERYFEDLAGYRSFWWILDPQIGERMAIGVYGQMIYMNPATETVVCSFSSATRTSNMLRQDFKQYIRLIRELSRSL